MNILRRGGEPLAAAATVVVLRDGPSGLETLLVRRTPELAFAGGNWVFPGGRVESTDRHGPDARAELAAARRAAIRETAEETALALDLDALVWFSHWTPPPTAPRRYATSFFATVTPSHDQHVAVDGSENDAWAWVTPSDAIALRDQGALELRPATWITLHTLRRFATAVDALDVLARQPVEYYATRLDTTATLPSRCTTGMPGTKPSTHQCQVRGTDC